MRSYAIDDNGKEHIYMFAPENWIIADSVKPGKAAQLFIDVLEDSTVIQTEKDTIDTLDTERMIRRLEVLQNRIIMLMSAPAIKRYEHFVKTYPDIIQRVPQKMIASYLGITPEALSTVKRSYLRKG